MAPPPRAERSPSRLPRPQGQPSTGPWRPPADPSSSPGRCISWATRAGGWCRTRCCAILWTHDGSHARMTDRQLPTERGAVRERPDAGGGAATPSYALPPDAPSGLPGTPTPLGVGPATLHWGERTFVMGVLNVTPDSFSGDGLL